MKKKSSKFQWIGEHFAKSTPTLVHSAALLKGFLHKSEFWHLGSVHTAQPEVAQNQIWFQNFSSSLQCVVCVFSYYRSLIACIQVISHLLLSFQFEQLPRIASSFSLKLLHPELENIYLWFHMYRMRTFTFTSQHVYK